MLNVYAYTYPNKLTTENHPAEIISIRRLVVLVGK